MMPNEWCQRGFSGETTLAPFPRNGLLLVELFCADLCLFS
jgi:hypothetical protein